MAYDQAQTPETSPQHQAAATKPPRWRQPSRRRSPAAAVTSAAEACPVAMMAAETAAVLRLKRQLRPGSADADTVLITALEAPDDFVRPSEMTDALWDRLKAIEDLASHRRAASLKGALFQLYLAASARQNPGGLLRTRLSGEDERELERNDRRVVRLHYAAIAYLERQVQDDDLQELRRWYFAPFYDVQQACDRGLHDRAALLEEAHRRPITPIENPG
jgi:hypothetical protein